MADFNTKLDLISRRGNPVGAEELIERIEAIPDLHGQTTDVHRGRVVGMSGDGEGGPNWMLWATTDWSIEVMPMPLLLLAAWKGCPSTLSGGGDRCRAHPSKSITET